MTINEPFFITKQCISKNKDANIMSLFLSDQEMDRKMSIFSISNCPTDKNMHIESLNCLCVCPGLAWGPVQAQANPVFFIGYCLNH